MPETHKQWTQRQRVWRHNAYLGQVKRAELVAMSIIHSDSTTPLAKAMATTLHMTALALKKELKNRIDP